MKQLVAMDKGINGRLVTSPDIGLLANVTSMCPVGYIFLHSWLSIAMNLIEDPTPGLEREWDFWKCLPCGEVPTVNRGDFESY